MKINIYQTVEVDAKQRIRIASVLDGKASKRIATRDELKSYIWESGKTWEETLSDDYNALSNDEQVNDEGDLIGVPEDEDLI